MARILLVDDDAASLDLMRRALSADGHETTIADGGAEARDQLQSAPGAFDVIVTDINMPGMNGLELLQAAHALNAGLRFVVISGFVDELERVKSGLPAGVETLPKPFTLDQIRQAVRNVLR